MESIKLIIHFFENMVARDETPRKAKVTQTSEATMSSCFWNCKGTVMMEYQDNGQTVMED